MLVNEYTDSIHYSVFPEFIIFKYFYSLQIHESKDIDCRIQYGESMAKKQIQLTANEEKTRDQSAKKPKKRGKETAESMAARQRDISVSEFFAKNRHLLGFDNPRKALLNAIKEAVDN